jgi:hypothetical protein
MSGYRVRLTKRALGHLERIDAWWRDYFDVDEAAGEILVVAVWHASRGRPPPISGR